jgi:hypothetical protein
MKGITFIDHRQLQQAGTPSRLSPRRIGADAEYAADTYGPEGDAGTDTAMEPSPAATVGVLIEVGLPAGQTQLPTPERAMGIAPQAWW